MNCNNMPEANHYFLESCPVVRSTGLDVESGKEFIWIPGSLPFFVSDASMLRITCPEDLKHYAEHVPTFESKVRFSRGLAATVRGATCPWGPFVFGVVAGSSEGSAAPAPPRDLVNPAREDRLMAEGEVPRVSARVQALGDEAVSKEHRLFHFPKNPCDTCNRAKLLARHVRRKPRPEHDPDEHSASCFGEVIAADHIHVYRSPDSTSTPSREYVVLCIRDKLTGLFAAFSCTDRSTDSVVVIVALRKFVGRKGTKTISLLSDAADTFEAAAKELGWIHCPSLPSRFPHNSQMKSEIRSFEEGVRSVFLNAGFANRPQPRPAACKYGDMALNLTAASPQDKSLTHGILLSLILVTMTSRPSNACSACRVSWSLTVPRLAISLPRMLHLGCLQVGDLSRVVPIKVLVWSLILQSSRTGLVLGLTRYQFLSKEICVNHDVPRFPLKDASEIALSRLGFDEVVMPDPLLLPFSTADVIRKKARRVYITFARFLELVRLPDAQRVRMIGPTIALSAFLHMLE